MTTAARPLVPAVIELPSGARRSARVATAAAAARRCRGALVVTALVAAGALLPEPALRAGEPTARLSSLRSLESLAAVAERARLVRPTGYSALAPLTTVSDELALLSVRQHIAVIATLLLLYAAWRVSRRLRGRARLGALGEAGAAVLVPCAILAAHAYGCLVPRPMAALTVRDPDVVRVDFHSHTGASHDGRSGFTAEDNRAWHRDGGFDVAYVTDHGRYEGAEAGARSNPERAGDGTVLLSGVEAWSGSEHLNVLGATAADAGLLTPDQEIDDAALERAAAAGRPRSVLIETVPGFLDTLVAGVAGGLPGRAIARVTALELSDAAPRGFEQSDSTRERVLRLADSLDLALVSGSDNHGWGRTAAAWSLVAVPGWRAMTPDSLGRAIEARILADRRGAVLVVERGRPATVRGAGVLLNAPIVAWHLFATLAPADRAGWLAWAWGATLLGAVGRRARSREERVTDEEMGEELAA